MANNVSYNYSPNQNVYVINTLGPNGQYPYWGFPFGFGGYGFGYPYGFESGVGYPNGYPNGFTSTTPAIQSGVVLQGRILISTSTNSPTIMYDIRVNGELGTTPFPENMVFPATPGVAGYQTVNYGGALTYNTPITVTTQTDTIYVDGTAMTLQLTPTYPTTVAAFLAAVNALFLNKAVFTLVGGNIVVTSDVAGSESSVVIVLGSPSLFAALPGFVAVETGVPGVASGLEQAQAYYATLSL